MPVSGEAAALTKDERGLLVGSLTYTWMQDHTWLRLTTCFCPD